MSPGHPHVFLCQECKVLTALPRQLLKVVFAPTDLRDEVMFSCGLTYCLLSKQSILEIQCSSAVMETHCVCSIHLGLLQLLHGSWGQGKSMQTYRH